MKVNFLGNSIYKSKIVKKGLEFAADKGALFGAGASFAFSTVARPIAIYSTPKTEKENRELACAKSFASSVVGLGIMTAVSLPISNSVKKIDSEPEKYLKPNTIERLKGGAKKLTDGKSYKFATQLFKLGIGAVGAIPKALVVGALIPPIMALTFKNKNKDIGAVEQQKNNTIKAKKSLNFTGNMKLPKEPLTKGIAKILNKESVQNFAEKYKDTNYAMHITAATDLVATGAFIGQTKKSKKIDNERKNTLIYNSAISTGLSIGTTYAIDKGTKKSTDRFIERFKEVNKESPKLDKYVEGIKIAKPLLILGAVYYCVIPFVSTFFAERIDNIGKKKAKS